MTKRYLISVEPIEPSGVVLTIAELPGLVIFGQTAEDALGWAREAIAFNSATRPISTKSRRSSWYSAGRADDLRHLRRCLVAGGVKQSQGRDLQRL